MSKPLMDDERRHEVVKHFMHSPAQLSTALVEYKDFLDQESLLKWGTTNLDKYLMKILPGRVYFFLGRPGHGKTSLLIALARNFGKQLVSLSKTGKQKVVFYVTWETLVEDYEVALRTNEGFSISDFMEGKVKRDTLVQQQPKRVEVPIWGMGERGSRESIPEYLTFDVVEYALLNHNEFFGADIEIAAVVLDYLQKIPLTGKFRDRITEVSEATYSTERLAKKLRCPFFVGVQASREVDVLKPPIPQARHGQWTSVIEQVGDGVYGLWRPIKTTAKPLKGPNGSEIQVTSNLVALYTEKQRGKGTGDTIWMYLSPDLCRLEDMQIDHFTGDAERVGADDGDE